MKVKLMKLMGGSFSPADDETAQRTDQLKNNQMYSCEITEMQDEVLHRRLMAMIGFGFKYWVSIHDNIQSTSQQ